MYTWDAANRLIAAMVGGVLSSFECNGLGNRTSQTVHGLTTEYVLDVAGGLPEVIIATTAGASTYYVQVQGQVLAQQEAGAWAYVMPDHLGSVRQLVNTDGQVVLTQSYDPFGVLLQADGSGESEFGYTGEQVDAGTGLVFLRARYYGSAVGRFLSEDTKPGIAYPPKSLHIYVYAWNNPVLLTDHSGLQPQPPECDDPTQICYTGTSGPQVAPSSPEATTPPTVPEPGTEAGPASSTTTDLVTLCYVLTDDEEREECIARVLKLPASKRFVGPVCPPPEPRLIMTSNLEGDPISSAGMGERKYSYMKASPQQVFLAVFLGGADDPHDRLALVGGTYLSKLMAEVTVYENGILTELREEYDASNLHGPGLGLDISVGRTVQVILTTPSVSYKPYLLKPVSGGEQGVSEEKKVWMRTDQGHIPSEALMRGAVSIENSVPVWLPGLGGGGYGWSYSLGLEP